MKNVWKFTLCLLLTVALVLSTVPVSAQAAPDYTLADEIFTGLYAALHSQKGGSATRMAQRYVENATGVAPGSVIRRGDALYWQTDDGITCHFSPQLHAKTTNSVTVAPQEPLPATKSTTATGRDVYLFAPYYGLDADFEGEGGVYDTWAGTLAHVTGGKLHRCLRENATVDRLARAMEDSAVILIDSHGDTDTGDSAGVTSYICLQNGAGLTLADYAYDATLGIPHACYGGRTQDGLSYYEVDGTTIAQHMRKEASANFIWNGICYGMATEGICTPLRQAGVGAVYGYSQAVSFDADRCWMGTVMDALTGGKSMANAMAAAKKTWGAWDYSRQICEANGWPSGWINDSAAQAASFGDAFPVLVSAQDAYPTNPDAVQAVSCDWLLPRMALTLTLSVPDGVKCPDIAGYVFDRGQLPTPAGRPRDASHDYRFVGWCRQSIPPRTSIPLEVFSPGARFSFGYDAPDDPLSFGDSSAHLYALYSYAEDGKIWYTTQVPDGPYDPYDPAAHFADMPSGTWSYDNVRYALAEALVNGYTDGTFRPEATIRRSEVVSILYRAAGSPEIADAAAFPDVAPGAWYARAVAWASAQGIVQGYTDGTFRPDLPVTRAQLAVLFCRWAGETAAQTEALTAFPDGEAVPDWAKKEMAWAVNRQLIRGSRIGASDYLLPMDCATRAQFVTILQRYQTV